MKTDIISINAVFLTIILGLMICGGCGKSENSASETNGVQSVSLTCNTNGLASVKKSAETNVTAVTTSVTNQVVQKIHVWGWCFGDGKVTFKCNKEFDANKLLDSLTITPKPKSLSIQTQKRCLYDEGNFCHITLTGDFDFKTTYSLKIHEGAAFTDGETLKEGIAKKFEMMALPSEISFASSGRYLPSGGMKAIAVNTRNVKEMLCQILRVPLQNIVQLLARENGKYKYESYLYWGSYGREVRWSADGKETEDIAIKAEQFPIPVKYVENKDVVTPIPIRVENGGVVSNGVYLVAIKKKKTVFEELNDRVVEELEEAGKGEFDYDDKYRLVCVTDIGVSVRKDGEGNLLIWATSLTKGEPLADLNVTVYEANNTVIATGVSNSDGIFRVNKAHKREPFAVVVSRKDGSDACFISLSGTSYNDADTSRPDYLANDKCEAFVWTERGIYRRNEQIMVHFILRNGKGVAPKPFPVELVLFDPDNKGYLKTTVMSDALGTGCYSLFSADDSQPSGTWTIEAKIPGKDGELLGVTSFEIEDFVPPQIRTAVKFDDDASITNLGFTVSAENLYGGPAVDLVAKATVFLADAPFAPKGWEGWLFGDRGRAAYQEQQNLECDSRLNKKGEAQGFWMPLLRKNPAAAIRASIQGTVIERGGRKVSSWGKAKLLHVYPYYIGVKFPKVITKGATCDVAAVLPDGKVVTGTPRELTVRIEKLDYVYGYKRNHRGDYVWESNIVRFHVDFGTKKITLGADGKANLALFTAGTGEYELWLYDEANDVSFRQTYRVSEGEGDNEIHSSLSNPTQITITNDKKVYITGDKPRLTVKSPFLGTACLSVFRDKLMSTRVFPLTNYVSVVELDAVDAQFTPSVDVVLNVVQAVKPGKGHLANRANGITTLRVDRDASRLNVDVKADVKCHRTGGANLRAAVKVSGADTSTVTRAVVTVVDEAINILTQEEVPAPYTWLGRERHSVHTPYDIYNSLLPMLDEKSLYRTGLKTGGGLALMMMNRFSLVPNRRFKPLSIWQADVPVTNGVAVVDFALPEFAGEVRVTAVAYTDRGTGSGSVQAKVAPNLIMQPDAPRFVAPYDKFKATITMANRTKNAGVVKYEVVAADGLSLTNKFAGEITLEKEETKTLEVPVIAGAAIGEGHLTFRTEGLDEVHTSVINLPVRPASTWEQKAGTMMLKPGETNVFSVGDVYMPNLMKRGFLCGDSALTELVQALRYLVEYPYGCLEQITSQVFPLVYAGGILNRLSVDEKSREDATNAVTFVEIGIQKVLSMVRANDFAMWVDVNYAPWNRNYSLWAAHFLVEAQKAGYKVEGAYYEKVKGFLGNWAMSNNSAESVYACSILALAGNKDLDRQLHWYDKRNRLNNVEKFMLARAFVATGDKVRAKNLLDAASIPSDIRGKAFAILTLLDYDPEDLRILPIVKQILDMRNAKKGHWLTTQDNAHALLSLGAFYNNQIKDDEKDSKPKAVVLKDGKETALELNKAKVFAGGGDLKIVNKGKGTGFLSFSQMSLIDPAKSTLITNGIKIVRTYHDRDGKLITLNDMKRGDTITVTLEVHPVSTNGVWYSDLVIEELLPACLEADLEIPGTKHKYELRRDVSDDRVVIFTLPFLLPYKEDFYDYSEGRYKNDMVHFCKFSYRATVVSKGEFVVPGASVEAMYDPEIRATTPSEKVTIAE